MFRLLAVLALACAAAPLAADGPPIEVLLRQLDDPAFARREQATRALIAAGPRALPALERLVARPPTLEAARRAAHIIARIRWFAIPGGKPVAGIQATLRHAKTRFRLDERIRFELELANVGARPVRLVPVHAFGLRETLRGWFTVEDKRLELGPRPATLVLVRPQTVVCVRPLRQRDPGSGPVVLPPGARLRRAVTLQEESHLDKFVAGDYEVQVIYHAHTRKLVAGAASDLESNVFRFRIVDR